MKTNSKFWQNAREIILVATAFWCCSEAGAVNWFVISSADDNGPATFTLRDVINNHAGPNDIINFAFPSSTTITLNPALGNQGELAINFDLTIAGPGATNLSIVNTGGRVFHVAAGHITFTVSNLTMTGQYTAPNGLNGNAGHLDGFDGTAAFGGGIYDESDKVLVVSNCIMVNCMAMGGKGGDAYVPITEGVRSEGNGGDGGYGSGGAISHEAGDLYVYGSTFITNSASGGKGGKGHDGGMGGNGGLAGKGVLDSGGGGGGAVEVEYNSAQFSIINSTFFNNSTSGGQGGQGGDYWVLGSGATADGGAGGAGGNASGGAIYIVSGCIACANMNCRGLDSCTVCGNWCNPGSGGSGGAGNSANGGTDGATGNPGTVFGGGLWFANAGCLKIANTIIADNNGSSGSTIVGRDIDAIVTSLGWNLIGDATGSSGWRPTTDLQGVTVYTFYLEPYVGPLQYYDGGPTPTLPPMACSPAIDAGANVWGNPTDQNGQPRTLATPIRTPYNSSDGTDIGAVEVQSFPAPPVLTITQSPASIFVEWTATNGPCYELQQTSDLSSAPWVPSPNQVWPQGNGQDAIILPLPVTGNMFYRLWYPTEWPQ